MLAAGPAALEGPSGHDRWLPREGSFLSVSPATLPGWASSYLTLTHLSSGPRSPWSGLYYHVQVQEHVSVVCVSCGAGTSRG